MTPLPLISLSVLDRDELEVAVNTYNEEFITPEEFLRIPSGLPYYVARALQSNPDYMIHLSAGMFKALMTIFNRAGVSVPNVPYIQLRAYGCIVNFAEEVCSYVALKSGEGIDKVYFLNEEQTRVMMTIHSGDVIPTDLPGSELTEEELNDIIISKSVVPTNSESLKVIEHTSRFSGATWFEEIRKKTIILAGVGGIGSWACLLLARVQPTNIVIYDDDTVESANMSGQLYGVNDVGRNKVDALVSTIQTYASFNSVFGISQKFTSESEAADIMICGFDSMTARKTFFTSWKNHVMAKSINERKHCLFIDGRLSAEYLEVYSISGDDAEAITMYEGTLFSDEEADETLCSYKQTSYMANLIGGFIVNSFTNFVANEVAGCPVRELPFKITYDGNNMQHKIY